MQHRINKLTVLALVALSLSFAAALVPARVTTAASTKCTAQKFSTKSNNEVCVGYIQRMLNLNDGSTLAVDNDFGSHTKAEVMFYQKLQKQTKKDMEVDGIVGPQTWGQLCAAQDKYRSLAVNAGCTMNAGTTSSSTTKKSAITLTSLTEQRDANHGCDAYTYRQGSKSTCVKYIQQMLNTLKPQPLLAVDGVYGPKTSATVKAWQQAFKVNGDAAGVLGSKTWDSLCFWDGHLPNPSSGSASDVSDSIFNAWTAAAKKAGCNL
jgi:peptidoglycan hydrolase-like protein with peptidoglycan-binding domain